MQSVSEKPFVIFLSAFIPSAILVCGAALLFPLTVTGRGLSKSRVELPAAMPPNVAQLSTHAKAVVGPPISRPETGRFSAEHGSAFDIAIGETNVSLTSAPAAMSPLSEANSLEKAETVNPAESTSGRLEGKAKSMGQTFKAKSEPPRLEQAELTPQGAAKANHEKPAAKRIAHASRPPETVPQLLGKPHLKPVALGPSTKPTASAAKAPARSAIASPYGARVWAALARHKPRAVQRGSTTVTFEIGASGALGYVRVSQSSGNARLDQMALQTVRNSAPFPLPPNGASSYTIRIDFQ